MNISNKRWCPNIHRVHLGMASESQRGLRKVMASSKAQRRSFDVALKLKAAEFAVKNGKEAAARKFDVDSSWIREWCK